MNPTERTFDLELFYDGACPLCSREARAIGRLDRDGRVRLLDIAARDFDAATYGRDPRFFEEKIRARDRSGDWIAGVEVFRLVYSLLGFELLVKPTRLPGVSQLLDWGYEKFAANRLRLTGRCATTGCKARTSTSA